MAKIVVTIKKKPGDPWVLTHPSMESTWPQYFTQQEIDEIIKPYNEYLRNMPGYIAADSSFTIEGDTATSVGMFSIPQLAAGAFGILRSTANEDSPIVLARNKLVKDKMNELGISYEVSSVLG